MPCDTRWLARCSLPCSCQGGEEIGSPVVEASWTVNQQDVKALLIVLRRGVVKNLRLEVKNLHLGLDTRRRTGYGRTARGDAGGDGSHATCDVPSQPEQVLPVSLGSPSVTLLLPK